MSLSPKAIYDWYRDTLRNPKYRWWIILGTLAYLVSPFDLAPDIIPIAGQIDDVILVSLLIAELSQIVMDIFQARQNDLKSKAAQAEETGPTVEANAIPVEDL
ncbi:YkvA family protein [[Limnothrix rosea] IAM M-220]|uniref:YkvA family protein n=1 Tax=[Limnothrix rosea] IAM M-220 TaxID=454133 RepID=UPI00095BFF51|nr:YkvA family protein [[Limnothrix rosea] IAM M-220]OKH17746.1 hypothetical protein NIES208_07945 [[Limnothrix rosea] IAM M-220]